MKKSEKEKEKKKIRLIITPFFFGTRCAVLYFQRAESTRAKAATEAYVRRDDPPPRARAVRSVSSTLVEGMIPSLPTRKMLVVGYRRLPRPKARASLRQRPPLVQLSQGGFFCAGEGNRGSEGKQAAPQPYSTGGGLVRLSRPPPSPRVPWSPCYPAPSPSLLETYSTTSSSGCG